MTRLAFLTLFFAIGVPVFAQTLTPATQAFLNAHPGVRPMFVDGRLIALYGVPFATDADPQTTTDQFAAAWIAANADALGVDGLTLQLVHTITLGSGKFRVFSYEQIIDGLPVHDTAVKLPVLLGSTELIGRASMRLVELPIGAFPPDLISAQDAITVASQPPAYQPLTTFTSPEKVIYRAGDGLLHRCWRFGGYNDRQAIQFFVGTNSGTVMDAKQLNLHFSEISGSVTGNATSGIEADGLIQPHYVPWAGLAVIDGTEECPSEEAFIQYYGGSADINGWYGDIDVPIPVRITTKLQSGRVRVVTHLGDPVTDCLDVGTSGVVPPLVLNSEPAESGTSQINAFLAVNRTHDWFKGLQMNFDEVDDVVVAIVNFNPELLPNPGPCGAQYIPMADNLWFSRGASFELCSSPYSCHNAAFSTIAAHEYGHFIQSRLPLSEPDGRFSEGIADAIAGFAYDTKDIGKNWIFHNESGYAACRNLDTPNVNRSCNFGVPCDLCLFDSVHSCGRAISGAFWDMRENFKAKYGESDGILRSDQLFTDFLFQTDGDWGPILLMETLMTDDDNMDLMDYTPNWTEIVNAFSAHGWTQEADAGIAVTWNVPEIPLEEGVDFIVSISSQAAPSITLLATKKNEIEIESWTIGRMVFGIPADIESVTTNWNIQGFPRDIVVEIGTDPFHGCRNLGSVAVASQGTNVWSDTRLQLAGSLEVGSTCVANVSGEGGRIAGAVAGKASGISAHSIGTGAIGAGVLEIGGDLVGAGAVQLANLDAGSTLDIGGDVTGMVQVIGSLGGTIDVAGFVDADGEINVGTIQSGGLISVPKQLENGARIVVNGDVAGGGRIQLSGGMASGSELDVLGDLDGTLEILGSTNQFGGTVEIGTLTEWANIASTGTLTIDPVLTTANNLILHGNVLGGGRIQLKSGVGVGGAAVVAGDLNGTLEIGVPINYGGSVLGSVGIGGNITGTIAHYGVTASAGVFDLGPMLATGKYTQTFNNPLAEWGGTLTVNGNMAGTLSFQTKLQDADLTVEGSMSGTIKTGEMYDSSLALNTIGYCSNSTSGSILIGNKYTVWTPDPDTHIVNLGNIDVWGDFTSTALLKISKYQPTELISAFGTVCYHRHMYGQEQVGVTNGTPPAILHCPTGQDPCCPGC